MMSSTEGRRRKKDPDRERTSPKSRDKDTDEKRERHKRSKSSRSSRKTGSTASTGEREGERPAERPSRERIRTPSSTSQTPTKTHRMAVVPEMERRGSLTASLGSRNGSKSSLSYPTLSKTHAKENIYAKGDVGDRRKSPFTPDPTDLGAEGDSRDGAEGTEKTRVHTATAKVPPSPPLTATTGIDLRKTASANSMRRATATDTVQAELERGRRSVDSGTRVTESTKGFGASRSSLREDDAEAYGTDLTSRTGSSRPSTVKQPDKMTKTATASPLNGRSGGSPARLRTQERDHGSPAPTNRSTPASEVTQVTDSDATSVAPGHVRARLQRAAASPTNSEASPASLVDSSPRTPTPHSILSAVVSAHKERPPTVDILVDPTSRPTSVNPDYGSVPIPPPPPPPPPVFQRDAPRVDYLLLNGGLPSTVVRNPLAAVAGDQATSFSQYASPRPGDLLEHNAKALFKPLQDVLDNYNAVMDRNGSLAVATGYRSVARRLLDRLEAVFARNISSEFCPCVMCVELRTGIVPGDDSAGVNWGEILELVSGRLDLPAWPPFRSAPSADGLGISDLATPFQKFDVDIPEEMHARYARESRKTKVAVQSWLLNQQDNVPPEELDDETLTFAMLTRIEPHQHALFYALLCGMDHVPPTPLRQQPVQAHGTPPLVQKAALALQRLYRLSSPPRDALVVAYLMQNPDMHCILATLAAVTRHEWEILVSGRFDGFLWSGAEGVPETPPNTEVSANSSELPRRFASPGPTPITPFTSMSSPRPGSTRPGAAPAPVQVDEDTEIAILAEVEREIHSAMDTLENAFENLHMKAEAVRERLRNRSAALLMAAQSRRGSTGIEVRTDTPAGFADVDETMDDLRSDIGPDDSASNVSHNRRRAHRHKARRPVADIVEEEMPSLAERVRRRF